MFMHRRPRVRRRPQRHVSTPVVSFVEGGAGAIKNGFGKAAGKAVLIYTGFRDGSTIAETCGQSWSSQACGRAIQRTGVDSAEALVGVLCDASIVLAGSCSAALAEGGDYLLNRYGIKVPPSEPPSSP